MGLLSMWKKKKEYTLAEVIKLLKKDEYVNYIPVQTPSGNYWLKPEERKGNTSQLLRTTNSILKTNQETPSSFKQKRDIFINELDGNGEYRKLSHDISESSSLKKGRVVPSYNNYQGARKYNQGNQYGQYR